MKKMMLLLLTLLIGSVASMNAQVRIGGTNDPNNNAVLDLNSNAGTNNKGLLLPIVTLSDKNNASPMSQHVKGMVVYNEYDSNSGSMGIRPGAYVNDGGKWLRLHAIVSQGAYLVTLPAGQDHAVYEFVRDNFCEGSYMKVENILPWFGPVQVSIDNECNNCDFRIHLYRTALTPLSQALYAHMNYNCWW